ncbi:hypothetical protein ES703_78945 [subsurface metagenome]
MLSRVGKFEDLKEETHPWPRSLRHLDDVQDVRLRDVSVMDVVSGIRIHLAYVIFAPYVIGQTLDVGFHVFRKLQKIF